MGILRLTRTPGKRRPSHVQKSARAVPIRKSLSPNAEGSRLILWKHKERPLAETIQMKGLHLHAFVQDASKHLGETRSNRVKRNPEFGMVLSAAFAFWASTD